MAPARGAREVSKPVARDAVAPNVDLGGDAFACEVEGCGVTKGTRAELGVHRWTVHRLRGTGKNAKAKATTAKSSSPGAANANPGGPAGGTPSRPSGSSNKPASLLRRKDGSDFCSGAWKLAAKYVVPKVSPGAGQVMVWQGSYAGGIMDAALAGTRIDRLVVQRAAGKGAKLTAFASLLLLPAAMFVAEQKPALVYDPTFQEGLRGIVKSNFKQLLVGKLKELEAVNELEELAAQAGESYWALDENGQVMLDDKGRRISMVDGLVAELLGMIRQPEGAAT
jgi:hypothetical protein